MRRQASFFSAGDERDFEAANFFGAKQEFRPVLRVTHGGCCRHDKLADADLIAQRNEALQGRQRPLDALGVKPTGARQRATEAQRIFSLKTSTGLRAAAA